MAQDKSTAPAIITLSLGPGRPFVDRTKMLVRITNDRDVSRTFWADTPTVQVNLQFHNGPGDDYRVIVNVPGYENSGTFVHANPDVHAMLDMLMIPNNAGFSFPAWSELQARFPATAKLIAAGVSADEASTRYQQLGKAKPLALASLMNLCTAMLDTGLGNSQTPMNFIQELIWDDSLAQDRFFAYADPAILPLVRAAATEGEFAEEKDPQNFHKGATCSYKQTQFDYSNVQLTFHENDKKTIGTTECIKIEPDMDLYKDLLSHGLLEVIPNLSTQSLTNPLDVLALRWIDAVQSDEPLFDPGYSLVREAQCL